MPDGSELGAMTLGRTYAHMALQDVFSQQRAKARCLCQPEAHTDLNFCMHMTICGEPLQLIGLTPGTASSEQQVVSNYIIQVFGECRVIAAFQGCVAVGTSSGSIFVLMPRSVNAADGKATGCASYLIPSCTTTHHHRLTGSKKRSRVLPCIVFTASEFRQRDGSPD